MTAPLTQTPGRRKRSVARARLRPGTGNITINGKTFAEYFPTDAQRMVVNEPLRVAEAEESYDIDASIHGGGVSGQAGHCAWRSPARSSSSTANCVTR